MRSLERFSIDHNHSRSLARFATALVVSFALSTASVYGQPSLGAEDEGKKPGLIEPEGFGVAGYLNEQELGDWDWNYGWNYHREHQYHSRFLPMIKGGPPGSGIAWDPGVYGTNTRPGCAQDLDNKPEGNPWWDDWAACTDEEIHAYGGVIEKAIRGFESPMAPLNRTWLMFNEPELWGSGSTSMDPEMAAKIYAEVTSRLQGFDPEAEFYCCGTTWHDGKGEVWMTEFLEALGMISPAPPIDGLHMHNYVWQGPDDLQDDEYVTWWTDETIQTMRDFAIFAQAAFEPDLPIVITEWSNPRWPAAFHDNYQAQFLENTARWLNSEEAATYGYIGAAWYVSIDPSSAPCQFAHSEDHNGCDFDDSFDGSGCDFEAREVFTDLNGNETASISAYGRTFNWDADEWPFEPLKSNGLPYNCIDYFMQDGGACGDVCPSVARGSTCRHADCHCSFDSRALWNEPGGELLESMTREGRLYSHRLSIESGNFQVENCARGDIDLAALSPYADLDGLCVGGECEVDSRTFFPDFGAAGKPVVIESFTSGHRLYELQWPAAADLCALSPCSPGTPDCPKVLKDGLAMTSAFYADEGGPCDPQEGPCRFTSRSRWQSGTGAIESITANEKYYNYFWDAGASTPTLMGGSGSDLGTTVPRYRIPGVFTGLRYPRCLPIAIGPTPLGEQYSTYVWGEVPDPDPEPPCIPCLP